MKKFNSLSLKGKLLSSFALIIIFFGAVMAILMSSQMKLGDLQDSGAKRFKNALKVSAISAELNDIYSISADAVINGDLEQSKKDMAEISTKKSANLQELAKIADSEAQKKILGELEKDYTAYVDIISKEMIPLLEKNKELTEEVRKIDDRIDQARAKAQGSVSSLQKLIEEESIKSDEYFDQTFQNGVRLSTIASVVGTILSILLLLYIASDIANQLKKIASELGESGNEVSSAATEIASASEELSQASTEQAASIQETSSSIDEISSMINSNTENAKKSSLASSQSLSSAERGKEVVENMIQAIAEINNSNNEIMKQIDETNKELENIVRIINEVGTKTKVINDIVFQTKLLSFNASVEAARAGEQGKGFSVVAEEVGNLATMSGDAALEISSMLEGSIQNVEKIVQNSKEKIGRLIVDGKEKVDNGTKIAEECGIVLNDIVVSAVSVSKMVEDITVASQEQAQGVHEITKAIAQLDQTTQQNSANAAESAKAASSLSNQAATLNLLVQNLVVAVEGTKET